MEEFYFVKHFGEVSGGNGAEAHRDIIKYFHERSAETYSDRVLGVNETIEVPTRTLLLITGNNVTIAGDFW